MGRETGCFTECARCQRAHALLLSFDPCGTSRTFHGRAPQLRDVAYQLNHAGIWKKSALGTLRVRDHGGAGEGLGRPRGCGNHQARAGRADEGKDEWLSPLANRRPGRRASRAPRPRRRRARRGSVPSRSKRTRPRFGAPFSIPVPAVQVLRSLLAVALFDRAAAQSPPR
jgi:hypothetical protein